LGERRRYVTIGRRWRFSLETVRTIGTAIGAIGSTAAAGPTVQETRRAGRWPERCRRRIAARRIVRFAPRSPQQCLHVRDPQQKRQPPGETTTSPARLPTGFPLLVHISRRRARSIAKSANCTGTGQIENETCWATTKADTFAGNPAYSNSAYPYAFLYLGRVGEVRCSWVVQALVRYSAGSALAGLP
jgi:hypothetical protein